MMKLATAIMLPDSELAGCTGSHLLSCHDYRHEVRTASTVQEREECGGMRFLRASSRTDQASDLRSRGHTRFRRDRPACQTLVRHRSCSPYHDRPTQQIAPALPSARSCLVAPQAWQMLVCNFQRWPVMPPLPQSSAVATAASAARSVRRSLPPAAPAARPACRPWCAGNQSARCGGAARPR